MLQKERFSRHGFGKPEKHEITPKLLDVYSNWPPLPEMLWLQASSPEWDKLKDTMEAVYMMPVYLALRSPCLTGAETIYHLSRGARYPASLRK